MTPTPSRDEMLACPFCGNAPHVENAAPIGGAAMIYCRSDECLGPSTTAATLQDAMVQWNTRLAVSASDGVQGRIPDGQQCNEQSGKGLSRATGGDATDPVQVFAYLVSKCGSGLLLELIAEGKTDTQARNQIIHYFLDFAAGEACRVARREGREPDTSKWGKATMKAFERAIKRTAPPAVAETDANAPDGARLVSGVSADPTTQPPESGER